LSIDQKALGQPKKTASLLSVKKATIGASMKIYSTAERKVVDFVPLEPGKVSFYACGPTVYNFAHVGNLRTYLFEDLLRRALELAGFEVNHVMNITDVGHLTDDGDEGEDKMIKSAGRRA
jgi:cysteinyl-tRNA synthetase